MKVLFHIMLLHYVLVLGAALYLDSSLETPPRFSITTEVGLPEAPSSRLLGAPRCYASDVFALTTALEIAYFRHTGRLPTFSQQEMIDCQKDGCNRYPNMEELVRWLEVHDRIAPRNKYPSYRAAKGTCRSAAAPDGLQDIRVTGMASISVENFESAILRYGSVMACINTTLSACPLYNSYSGGIIDGYPAERCNHYVTIIGYTNVEGVGFYTVRNDRGPNWGENGNFRILRGKNACGIENKMSVLLTEPRTEPKNIDASSGCPDAFPVYCPGTQTCRSHAQYCVPKNTTEEDNQKRLDKERNRVVYNINSQQRRHTARSLPSHCQDNPRYNCEVLFNKCNYRKVQSVCGATCHVCDEFGEYRCKDQETPGYGEPCSRVRKLCRISTAIMIKCPFTCNMNPLDCGTTAEMIRLLVRHEKPATGACWTPFVENGHVMNSFLMNYNEPLRIQCDPGYILAGEQNYCEVQNLFGPDSRLIQNCILDQGSDFTGNGMDYQGQMAESVGGRPCLNWRKLAVDGDFETVEFGREMFRLGNHNFCRNPWGQDMAPYCISKGGAKEFCFRSAKCGGGEDMPCGKTHANPYPYCDRYNGENCLLSHERAQKRVDWYWRYCPGFCCQYIGCQ